MKALDNQAFIFQKSTNKKAVYQIGLKKTTKKNE